MTFRVEPWFKGKRVVIIGGGESLTLRQIHAVARARLDLGSNVGVIAVNDAVFVAWWADWLHACDYRWWKWHVQRVQWFQGIKTTLDPQVPEQWANRLNNTGKEGFDEDPANVKTGGNGGYQAAHCAIHAGAREIILLGIDMDMKGHWFGGHPTHLSVNRPRTMLKCWEGLVPVLKQRRIRMFNASPASRIECWPKIDIERHLLSEPVTS